MLRLKLPHKIALPRLTIDEKAELERIEKDVIVNYAWSCDELEKALCLPGIDRNIGWKGPRSTSRQGGAGTESGRCRAQSALFCRYDPGALAAVPART